MAEPRGDVLGRWYDEKAGCEVVSAEVHDRLSHESVGYVDFWRGETLRAEQELQGAVTRAEKAEARVTELEEALSELVRLKDGPRGDAYRAAKDAAWDRARSLLDGGGED